ncbi:MFS transporter [Euzebyella saccharophila]|uniref:Nitrate/nitrite transporter n=1 Tax=Euzebyella saccharophila TaxID=679664 RepID=A0ABV8JRZ5_9FLAO|nr:MFS transporter [Euzebyella saccharophila]
MKSVLLKNYHLKPKPYILPIIIIAQFACTSVWFAGNSIVTELAQATGFGEELKGYILSSVQFGFILGTLTFALLMIADRFSPSRVFLFSALLAALCNVSLLLPELSKMVLLSARFGTGFFLAGIYPIGMKIATDYYESGLGKALGYLVGALVFGKSLPYFIKSLDLASYTSVVQYTSGFTVAGGILLWALVPDGPFRKQSKKLNLKAGPDLFKITSYRKAAFGYFGHMWELYAFWAFIPFAMYSYLKMNQITLPVSVLSAVAIAIGGVSCIFGGYLSQSYSSKKVAYFSLWISGLCCLLSPFIFFLPTWIFMLFFGIWGMAVTADSPQFSSMVASTVTSEMKGTALVLVNCIGFAISIFSIELLSYLTTVIPAYFVFLVLALGPIFGLLQFRKMQTN